MSERVREKEKERNGARRQRKNSKVKDGDQDYASSSTLSSSLSSSFPRRVGIQYLLQHPPSFRASRAFSHEEAERNAGVFASRPVMARFLGSARANPQIFNASK